MTTINDRLEKLEEAYVKVPPLLYQIIGLLETHSKILGAHTDTLNSHTDTLDAHTDTLNSHTDTLDAHTAKLDAIIGTLNEHSVDLKLIKEYLG